MSDAAANTSDLFEVIRTTRSMRRLKPDPVPNELIRKILEAGVCAPSGGNMQRWRFLVVRDPKVKEMAEEKGVTPAQLAIAWVLAQGDDLVPIPGTKRRSYLEQNAAAVDIELTRVEGVHGPRHLLVVIAR